MMCAILGCTAQVCLLAAVLCGSPATVCPFPISTAGGLLLWILWRGEVQNLAAMLGIRGAIPALPHMTSWRGASLAVMTAEPKQRPKSRFISIYRVSHKLLDNRRCLNTEPFCIHYWQSSSTGVGREEQDYIAHLEDEYNSMLKYLGAAQHITLLLLLLLLLFVYPLYAGYIRLYTRNKWAGQLSSYSD